MIYSKLGRAVGSRKTCMDFDTLSQAQKYLQHNAGKFFGVVDI